MTSQEILRTIGQFSSYDIELFEEYTSVEKLKKNDTLLEEGNICRNFYFIRSGSFVQFRTKEIEEQIIDLHLTGEWMFNQESITEQKPSTTTFKAFAESEVIMLSLSAFHCLCSKSQSFLQFGKVMNQSKIRTTIFDNSLNPADKYSYINEVKPELTKVFPVKMIASYLKVAPETLSRVRANYSIS
jgi:CRP-like cAMP-binding protein